MWPWGLCLYPSPKALSWSPPQMLGSCWGGEVGWGGMGEELRQLSSANSNNLPGRSVNIKEIGKDFTEAVPRR